MDLESLKAMATPGSHTDEFIQSLERRMPFPAPELDTQRAPKKELKAVAAFLYETFGFDLLIDDWRIHADYDGFHILDHLPLTQEDCRKLVTLEVDTVKGRILKKAYPKRSLPLSTYLQFSLMQRAYCLDHYSVSNEILNYEMTQIDDVLENTDNVYMVDEWLWSLWEALLRKQRLADAEQVKAVRTQLAKQL